MVFARFYEHSFILTIFHIFVSEATNYWITDTNIDESTIDRHCVHHNTMNYIKKPTEAYIKGTNPPLLVRQENLH